jgi:hypothetical protein
MRPPSPDEGLRDRVLQAARAAVAAARDGQHDGAGLTLVDRLWESRRLRLGWAVLCAALVAGHAALSSPDPPVAAPLAAAESTPEELGISRELLSQAQLERLRQQGPGPDRPRLMEIEKESL